MACNVECERLACLKVLSALSDSDSLRSTGREVEKEQGVEFKSMNPLAVFIHQK